LAAAVVTETIDELEGGKGGSGGGRGGSGGNGGGVGCDRNDVVDGSHALIIGISVSCCCHSLSFVTTVFDEFDPPPLFVIVLVLFILLLDESHELVILIENI